MKERILTFEVDPQGEMLRLFGTPEELIELADNIKQLVNKTKDGHFEHEHFLTPEWGGDSLTSERQSKDGTVIHHLKAYCIRGGKPQP